MSEREDLECLPASGVDALIARLRDQGVANGRAQAEQIVAEGQRKAEQLLREAEQQAADLVARAREEADSLRLAGEEALRVAMRDTVLEMKTQLSTRFSNEMRRLVATELKQEAFLQRLTLEIAGRAREEAGIDQAEDIEIVLPRDLVGLDDLKRRPEELQAGSLAHFVLNITDDLLREGIRFRVADRDQTGIRVSMQGGEIQVDLTDAQVAAALLEHLHPRFRAILEGTVK
mgnify:CR=1 FL=1